MARTDYYGGKDYTYLFKQALLRARDQQLLNVSEEVIDDICAGVDIENIYSLFLSVYTDTLAEYYQDAQKIYNANDLNFATGHDLDLIGIKLGLERFAPTKASTTLQFTTEDSLTSTVEVPIGVEVTGPDGIIYETTESFTFNPVVVTASVGAISKTAGTSSRVKTGELNKVLSDVSGLDNLTVINTSPSYGGKDRESDENYSARLFNWRHIEQRGNEYAYRNVLNKLDGLSDYRLIPKHDGAGTVKIITIPGTSTVRQNVYDAIQSEAVLFDEDITVVGATEYAVEVYCNIYVDYDTLNPYSSTEKQDISNRTRQAIVDYVDSLGIGEDFIPFKCGVYINQAIPEIKDITFTSPAKPVVVDDESIIKLTTIDVIYE